MYCNSQKFNFRNRIDNFVGVSILILVFVLIFFDIIIREVLKKIKKLAFDQKGGGGGSVKKPTC